MYLCLGHMQLCIHFAVYVIVPCYAQNQLLELMVIAVAVTYWHILYRWLYNQTVSWLRDPKCLVNM